VLAKLNDARYHRRQFPPGLWVRTRPLLRHGRVQTLVDPLTRPNFGNKEIDNLPYLLTWWSLHSISAY